MPHISDKQRTGTTTSTTAARDAAPGGRAALEEQLLRALRGNEGGAPLPPAQAKRALALAEALLARMEGAAAATGGAGVAGLDEKTRNELIVKTWSEEWQGALPKMSKEEHAKLAAEFSSKIRDRQKDIAPNGQV